MQKIRFYRPEKQPRSVPPQELGHVLVPGKRKPLIRQTLPPNVPVIDNRKWYTVAQVVAALAGVKGKDGKFHPTMHKSFANQALAEARAYEMWFSGTQEITEIMGAKQVVRRDKYTLGKDANPRLDATSNNSDMYIGTYSKTRLVGNDPFNGEPRWAGFHRAKKGKPTNGMSANSLRAYMRKR